MTLAVGEEVSRRLVAAPQETGTAECDGDGIRESTLHWSSQPFDDPFNFYVAKIYIKLVRLRLLSWNGDDRVRDVGDRVRDGGDRIQDGGGGVRDS